MPQVTSLTLRRLAALPADTRPLPTVSAVSPAHAAPHRQGRPVMTRARGITEEAADAAVDTACRVLRLPTIRGQFAGSGRPDDRQPSYRGSGEHTVRRAESGRYRRSESLTLIEERAEKETMDSAPWRNSSYSGTNGSDCVEGATWGAASWSATRPTTAGWS